MECRESRQLLSLYEDPREPDIGCVSVSPYVQSRNVTVTAGEVVISGENGAAQRGRRKNAVDDIVFIGIGDYNLTEPYSRSWFCM